MIKNKRYIIMMMIPDNRLNIMYKGHLTFQFYKKDNLIKPKFYYKKKANKYIKYVNSNNKQSAYYYLMSEEQLPPLI